MTTLVLGMGNPILSDDGLGLVVAHRLRELPMPPDVEVAESEVGGLRLLELVRGFTKVVIIDALRSGGTPGAIGRVDAESSAAAIATARPTASTWAPSSSSATSSAYPMPDEVVVYTVEALDVETFGEQLSEPVAAAAERLVGLIGDELRTGACPPSLAAAS